MIYKALMFAKAAHTGQYRKFNKGVKVPYITHPISVASRVMGLSGVTEEMIAAALLHDVIEDTSFTIEQVATLFGIKVANLISELTNVSSKTGKLRAERKKMDRDRIAKTSHEARIIKACDRIENLLEINDQLDEAGKFAKLYADESILLIEALGDIPDNLKDGLRNIAQMIMINARQK